MLRTFFRDEADAILLHNLRLLRSLTMVTALLLLVIFLFVTLGFPKLTLSITCIVMLLIQVPLCAVSNLLEEQLKRHPRVLHALMLLYLGSVLGFITCVSIFINPSQPGVYFGMMVLVVQLAFVFPLWHNAGLTLLATVLYCLLCVQYKHAALLPADISAAFMGWLLGVMTTITMMQIRLHCHEQKVQLRRLTTTDSATGLMNRQHTENAIWQWLQAANPQTGAALIVCNLDGMKQLINVYGQEYGYKVLEQIGQIFRALCTEQSIVGRTESEEFVMLLQGVSTHAAAERFAHSLRAALDTAIRDCAHHSAMNCTYGVAIYPLDGTSYATLYHNAAEEIQQFHLH